MIRRRSVLEILRVLRLPDCEKCHPIFRWLATPYRSLDHLGSASTGCWRAAPPVPIVSGAEFFTLRTVVHDETLSYRVLSYRVHITVSSYTAIDKMSHSRDRQAYRDISEDRVFALRVEIVLSDSSNGNLTDTHAQLLFQNYHS